MGRVSFMSDCCVVCAKRKDTMARYPTGLLEEELKNKVAADWFAAYDTTRIIGKVDKALSNLNGQKKVIIRKLDKLRAKKMMTKTEFAALMGKSPSYYSVVLNRGCALTVESLAKIASAFERKIELRLVRSNTPMACGRSSSR